MIQIFTAVFLSGFEVKASILKDIAFLVAVFHVRNNNRKLPKLATSSLALYTTNKQSQGCSISSWTHYHCSIEQRIMASLEYQT